MILSNMINLVLVKCIIMFGVSTLSTVNWNPSLVAGYSDSLGFVEGGKLLRWSLVGVVLLVGGVAAYSPGAAAAATVTVVFLPTVCALAMSLMLGAPKLPWHGGEP